MFLLKLKVKSFRRNTIAALHDAVMAGLSFVLALWLRLGQGEFDTQEIPLAQGTFAFVALCMALFLSMRLYRGLWRYASPRDMLTIFKAVSLAILIFYSGLFLFNRLENMPRSVVIIHWMALLVMLTGPRLAYRALKDRSLRYALSNSPRIPVLLVGASHQAELFLMEMLRHNDAAYEVVGILDNTGSVIGGTMHHVPIYGHTDILPVVINKLARKGKKPQRILLAGGYHTPEELRVLLEQTHTLGIPLARLPSLSEFKQQGDQPALRSIDVEDLLGRAQNVHDQSAMRALVAGKRVLITGAGGSIGSELVRQIATLKPAQIVLLEQSEYALYLVESELAELNSTTQHHAVLCDVGDMTNVEGVFARFKPELVFHAAAIKHVPIGEQNVEETIWTNVFGTKHIADACEKHGCHAMVLISTDKAVNPTSVMGTTKRLAESYCQALGQKEGGRTKFITVRFGNVLGSTGSVVPLFQKQLAKGGPITITHPEIERYFMTVREAVELVIQAASLGCEIQERREHIFVLDMGKPVKIRDLACQMIRLAGLTPERDIQIIYTGLRPGEKLYEELFHLSENVAKTSHESLWLAAPRKADLQALETSLALLREACARMQPAHAIALLKTLVPEYQTNEKEQKTA